MDDNNTVVILVVIFVSTSVCLSVRHCDVTGWLYTGCRGDQYWHWAIYTCRFVLLSARNCLCYARWNHRLVWIVLVTFWNFFRKFFCEISNPYACHIYRVRQSKVAPWSFSLFSQQLFRILIWSFTDLFTKMFYIQQVKCDSVEKRRSYRLLNMTTYQFLALKMFKLKMLFYIQKPVTTLLSMTSQWRFDKQ